MKSDPAVINMVYDYNPLPIGAEVEIVDPSLVIRFDPLTIDQAEAVMNVFFKPKMKPIIHHCFNPRWEKYKAYLERTYK